MTFKILSVKLPLRNSVNYKVCMRVYDGLNEVKIKGKSILKVPDLALLMSTSCIRPLLSDLLIH